MAHGLTSFFKNLLVPQEKKNPQRNKIQDNSYNEDDNKSKPREEWNTEVENILDTLKNMSQESKMFLYLKSNLLHRLHLLLQTLLLAIITLGVTSLIIILLFLLLLLPM